MAEDPLMDAAERGSAAGGARGERWRGKWAERALAEREVRRYWACRGAVQAQLNDLGVVTR